MPEPVWWLPVGTAVLIPRAARFWVGAVPIRTTAPTSNEHTMACTNPQCDGGIIPNPYSEDLTLCPACNHGYDPRDYAG
ncbi:hypothetical protein ACFYP6_18495 [Streptomyces goshikiensis]|uniref:hypothetical protein n=1 Tax=Streptomyces goshikiensis TaxID=1942 RepID=UPI00368B1202